MNLSAEYFRVWRTNKESLEEVVRKKDDLKRQVKDSEAPRLYFSVLCQVDGYLQAIDQVRLAGTGGMNYNHIETLKLAERAALEVAAATLGKNFLFRKTEAHLDSLVQRWERQKESRDKENCLIELMDVCSFYGPATAVSLSLQPENFEPNSFYGGLSRLSFIASKDLAKKYLEEYASCSSLGELQRFKTFFERNFVEPIQSLRTELGSKYRSKKYRRENRLVHAEPLAVFRRLYKELQQTGSSSEWQELFFSKKEMAEEAKKIEAVIGHLVEEPQLEEDPVVKISVLSLVERDFGQLSCLYLEENLRRYQAVFSRGRSMLDQRRQQILELIHVGINASAEEMNHQISLKEDKAGYLSGKKTEVERYQKRLQLLGFPEDVPLMFIERKIDTLAHTYGVVLGPGALSFSLPLLGGPEAKKVGEKEVGGNNEERDSRDLNAPEKGERTPAGKMEGAYSSLELVHFAYQKSFAATNPQLAGLCQLVAGVRGSQFDPRPFSERIKEAKSVIIPELGGDDFNIYAALRGGLARVGM